MLTLCCTADVLLVKTDHAGKAGMTGIESSPAQDTSALHDSELHIDYDVTALSLTIYYNRDGDHDHDGMMFALTANVPILKYIKALARSEPPRNDDDRPEKWQKAAEERAKKIHVELPRTPAQARQPHPLVRPLVLRARKGERVRVKLHNDIRHRDIGIHLVADGYDVKEHDGSQVGNNGSSLVAYGESRTYDWHCRHEGVFPFHDAGNYSGGEDGTNVHGLFGALIVEPEGTIWRDPVTGFLSHSGGQPRQLDGLYVDVLPKDADRHEPGRSETTLENHVWPDPEPYFDFGNTPHREFVIFFHDEPEFLPAHGHLEASLCDHGQHNGRPGHGDHGGGQHGGHDDLPIMPISYRAEPMINRERRLWRLLRSGHGLERPVLNEEQHHSSWMFGDPVTPILKAYIGDPVRIRFVHAAVKETHVFHLHLYEWHAVAGNRQSPRIDAISVSPQTGHTIEPVWGAGNRHQVAGDVIWHCHLYPHFHEGMWGMFRTFETRQHGRPGAHLYSDDPVYAGRRIGLYPDGTLIEKLLPLPGRVLPPEPTPERPGYPLYIPGKLAQKSPRPPWPDREFTEEELHQAEYAPPPNVTSLLAADMPADFDYRPIPTDLERRAFNERPVPGELFTRNPLNKQQAAIYDPTDDPPYPGRDEDHRKFRRNVVREVAHDMVVAMQDIVYNSHGWHDIHGHLYYLEADGDPATRSGSVEPLFFRARHGQIVNVTLRNATPTTIRETAFDHAFPPCRALPWEGECAAHVHMVKFDPICADGAATGWNYISGARHGRRMVYRWWADQEFGTIFFHDHLFANHRQKHGLFGALLVEPAGSHFLHPIEPGREIVSGVQAMIVRHEDDKGDETDPQRRMWFREFCIGIGDFIPMWNRRGEPLNPPAVPGGHGDQGVMGLNYRSAPVRERPGDPAYWFSSRVHGDPDTTIFRTYADDPIWIRILQGSHEEQHSFQIHGLRWRRFRAQMDSAIRNQQSLGISEAFTFINEIPFGPGDYMYKLSSADDLWLGCWGLIRALPRPQEEECLDLPTCDQDPCSEITVPPMPETRREFRVTAERQSLSYRPTDIVDPFGLVYRLTEVKDPDGEWVPAGSPAGEVHEPLVLWCREGEQVVVELHNGLDPGETLKPEPHAPEVPVERPKRQVSMHVSMHADLLRYDILTSDGTNAGANPPQTVPPGSTRTYYWDTSRPGICGTNEGQEKSEPLGPVLLQDMADFRNHRHHGLIGALVVLPEDATPFPVEAGSTTASSLDRPVWHGARVTVVEGHGGASRESGDHREEHMVLLMQDGLRLFTSGPDGGVGYPLPDPPQEEPGEGEKEDQGQKGFNYRSEPIGPVFDPQGHPYTRLRPDPATPVWQVASGASVKLHLVGACDKPRHHSFTIHGVAWEEHRFDPPANGRAMVSSESAVTCGTVRTLTFMPEFQGDHAYRSGVLRWDVPQGMWGVLRVREDGSSGVPVAVRDKEATTASSHPHEVVADELHVVAQADPGSPVTIEVTVRPSVPSGSADKDPGQET